jgi:hypothetical protein
VLKTVFLLISLTSIPLRAEHARGFGNPGMGNGGYGAGSMGDGYGMGGMGGGMMGGMGMGMGGGMMGGMGGGGGGSGGGSGSGGGQSYQSKRDEIAKTFEQPAQDNQKKIQELTKETIEKNQKAAEATTSFFKSLEPKDVKLDDSTVKQLSSVESPSDSKAVSESTKEMLDQIARAGETTAKLAAEQAKAQTKALQASAEVPEEASATLLTLGKKIESFTSSVAAGRSPASTPQAEALGVRGFAGAHNPPTGFGSR